MGLKNFVELPVKKLVAADWNYKTEDEKLSEKLQNNIKRNGQIENILVRPLETGFYEVVNGNHRFKALKNLGIKKAICYDLGDITQQAAQRIAIETNETKFETDNIKLAELINEITREFPIEELEETMPFSEQELENFNNLLEFDWEQFENEGSSPAAQKVEGDFNIEIKFFVNQEIKDSWEEWKDKLHELAGIDADYRAFEFAIVEALNLPDESINS